MKKTLLSLMLFISTMTARAAVIYVDSANFAGFQDGMSWATAYSSFQAGINAANAFDSVWVAKGTYQPTVNTSFSMKEKVRIFGGFLASHTSFSQRDFVNNITVLKGNNKSVIVNNFNGSESITNITILDGFTVTL